MPDFSHERRCLAQGFLRVAGVDEVGRGPLAGPVVAAAVRLDPMAIPDGLDDSKLLGVRQREELFELILASSDVGIAMLPPAMIDRINIRNAALEAMRHALSALATPADHALIDGKDVPVALGISATTLIKGDSRSVSIAAASIIAKVARDRLMTRLDAMFPIYGFARNMGYPTAQHRAAIAIHGGTLHHRRSFNPFKNETL